MVRKAYGVCLIAYSGVVAWVTLRHIPGSGGSPQLIPFLDTWQQMRDYGDRYTLREVAGNFVLFVPLGYLLAAWARRNVVTIAAIAGAASIAIEACQWVLVAGRSPSVDDVIYNTMGAASGAILFVLLRGALAFWRGPRNEPAASGGRIAD